ncbi:hypothetical protein BT96DRAFT_43959 [Gymnopus androsaceus JB14]|uniref:F-box domain-containing protein n=1 Tax=Gymnopus androsaceus JB14 TaxID=1447944 RepID=A0A6A4HKP9_9AGAR|nr:hypothetical protein BT96DRAFT_43959 [Gymnopus androsaceus JB14]
MISTVVPRLPNELVECILDNLYFDKDTLLSCALVASAWVTPSQRGIFRLITLKLPDSKYRNSFSVLFGAYLQTSGLLIALFNEKPYLASYVRALELVHFQPKLRPTPKVSPEWEALSYIFLLPESSDASLMWKVYYSRNFIGIRSPFLSYWRRH